MHEASVRYHRQLKTIEYRNKMSIIENRFESTNIESEFMTVCLIETEVNIEDD